MAWIIVLYKNYGNRVNRGIIFISIRIVELVVSFVYIAGNNLFGWKIMTKWEIFMMIWKFFLNFE